LWREGKKISGTVTLSLDNSSPNFFNFWDTTLIPDTKWEVIVLPSIS